MRTRLFTNNDMHRQKSLYIDNPNIT